MIAAGSKAGVYLFALMLMAGSALGQAPAAEQNAAEMTSHDTPATFRTKVNLVLVPVVVRDKQGHAVGSLTREDFQVFDRKKPQLITHFAVETRDSRKPEAQEPPALESPGPNAAPTPDRFVAYFFDDIHLNFGDLAQARDAAEKHINELTPADRAGIFTSSGRTTLDFTDDRVKLHDTLMQLRPQPIARSPMRDCPDISYYQADLIQNKNDMTALQAAELEDLVCHPPPQGVPMAQAMQMAATNVQAVASRVYQEGFAETRLALTVLRDVVRRVAVMPGQRSIILISPGFLTLEDVLQDKTDIIDRAIRGNVVISSLNARGLYTIIPGGDATQQGSPSPQAAALKSQFASASALAEEDVLAELANGTGGVYFHNNNDLKAGFERVAARPEFIYVLGFSPQNLKLDGSFHALKVSLKEAKFNLQARRGYYAPKHLADEQETAKEEVQDALFSREEMRDIPVELHTQFFKTSPEDAKLAVLVRVDIKHLRFRKENGRNRDDLMVVAGLFDHNGNLISGNQKTVEMRLRDQTLESRLGSGITIRNSFDVKAGSYVIRLVVRDSEGQEMAAANGAVEIPFN